MDVQKTSSRILHPKGETTIPQSSLSVIKRRERQALFGTGERSGILAGASSMTYLAAALDDREIAPH